MNGVLDRLESLDKLSDAHVQGMRGLIAGCQNPRVRNDVIALVGIFADGRLQERKIRHVLPDFFA